MMSASVLNSLTPRTATEEVEIEIEPEKFPYIDEKSLEFLKSIVRNDLRILEFEDDLKIFSLSGSEIGNFHISVKPLIYKNENCFNVKAKSNGLIDGAPCGTEVNAYVNHKLETIDQEQFEFIKLPNGHIERKVLIKLETKSDYVITKTENHNNQIKKTNYRIKKSLMNGYISESSNILLQRLMVQNSDIQEITLFTFDSEMNPCNVIYRPLDTRRITIEDDEMNIKGIERTIEFVSDIPTTWQIYFSQDGHMINRVQIGYPAVFKTVSKPKPIEIDEYLPEIIIGKKEINWEEDMQMRSKYLDRKEELKNEYNQYLTDHPELKQITSDYLQAVLSIKPKDVLSFTAKHFAPYSKKTRSNQLLPSLDQAINIPKH
ncbi:unnamed protein product [Brachionus calyciflorus]|uniref:Ciliogenesis-associated TTC17-interacting protein n=1 Tax=Brachionus calyciflorus TaxID=104777 RepID=A0A814EJP7_9BILA|nr:unnamed protein product [Brachionus calyciflorus]